MKLTYFGLAALLLGGALLVLRWPEAGTILAVFLFYLNVPSLAVHWYGLPYLVAAASTLLFVPALVQNFVGRHRPIVIDLPFLLMIVFLGSALVSTIAARESDLALHWIFEYLSEGVLLYFLVLNSVRSRDTLRRVVWALLVAGSLLSTLTLYQELTGSYSNEFGGLAQRTLIRETQEDRLFGQYEGRTRTKVRLAHRAQGPIDDPNRYAQLLLVLLPLGLARLKDERTPLAKGLALSSIGVILGGVLLTYSRGAFLATVSMLVLMVFLRWVRVSRLLIAGIAMFVMVLLVSPGYINRMATLGGLEGLVSRSSKVEPDAVQRARAAVMLAAWNVFLDYPILGVGPGHFSPVYSLSYMSEQYSLRHMTEKSRGHSLYLELAAEMGVVGIMSFMIVVIATMVMLWSVRRRHGAEDPELANLATAFALGIVGYLVSAIFLQLSFQRYYWLLLALGGATAKIAESAREAVSRTSLEPSALPSFSRIGRKAGPQPDLPSR